MSIGVKQVELGEKMTWRERDDSLLVWFCVKVKCQTNNSFVYNPTLLLFYKYSCHVTSYMILCCSKNSQYSSCVCFSSISLTLVHHPLELAELLAFFCKLWYFVLLVIWMEHPSRV